MRATGWRSGTALAMACMGLLAGGCTKMRDHKGYVVDSALINSVAPGVDNRDSVMKTLGRPSFESQFDQGAAWYYLSRDTRQLAFATPSPAEQLLLTVRFAASGDVASVQKTGVETIRDVRLYGKKTPTNGRNRGFLAELFGNVGASGVTAGGGTADNPDGN